VAVVTARAVRRVKIAFILVPLAALKKSPLPICRIAEIEVVDILGCRDQDILPG
jgi:hypothetical protein